MSQVVLVILGKRFNYTQRLVPLFIAAGIIIFAIPFLCLLSSPTNFVLVLLILLIFGAVSGFIQGTVYSMAAGVSLSYMGIVFLGNGVCGIFCNALRAITLLSFPTNDPDTKNKNIFLSALVFFLVATVWMFLCCFLQIILSKNVFYIYYLDWQKNPKYL